MMKLSVLVIYFTNIILRATSTYVPFVLVHNDDHSSLFLLAGFLTFLLLSLWKRKPVTVATSTTRTTITTARPQPRCNDGYTLYSGPGKRFCYRFSTIFRTWESSQKACQMENAELLVLDNDSLSAFGDVMRQKFPPGGATWLRAKTGVDRIASFIGGPNIPSNSPLWVEGEPDNPNDCIFLGYDNNGARLLDEPCDTFVLLTVCASDLSVVDPRP